MDIIILDSLVTSGWNRALPCPLPGYLVSKTIVPRSQSTRAVPLAIFFRLRFMSFSPCRKRYRGSVADVAKGISSALPRFRVEARVATDAALAGTASSLGLESSACVN
jgi:hypothetical protein